LPLLKFQPSYNATQRRVCATIVAVENIGITYSELVFVALGMQHAKLVRRVMLLSLTSPTLQHVSTLSHKWYDFRKKATEHKMCVLILLSIFSEIFLILRRTERDIIINVRKYDV